MKQNQILPRSFQYFHGSSLLLLLFIVAVPPSRKEQAYLPNILLALCWFLLVLQSWSTRYLSLNIHALWSTKGTKMNGHKGCLKREFLI